MEPPQSGGDYVELGRYSWLRAPATNTLRLPPVRLPLRASPSQTACPETARVVREDDQNTSEHLADGEMPTRAPQSGASPHGVAEVDANGRQGCHDAKAEANPDLEIRD